MGDGGWGGGEGRSSEGKVREAVDNNANSDTLASCLGILI